MIPTWNFKLDSQFIAFVLQLFIVIEAFDWNLTLKDFSKGFCWLFCTIQMPYIIDLFFGSEFPGNNPWTRMMGHLTGKWRTAHPMTRRRRIGRTGIGCPALAISASRFPSLICREAWWRQRRITTPTMLGQFRRSPTGKTTPTSLVARYRSQTLK